VNDFSHDKKARLLELLSRELEIFKQIHGFTKKQTELLEVDDLDAFNKSLDSRQGLIEKINGLHQEANILMQSYIAFSNSPTGEKIDEVENAYGRLHDLIAECAAMNEKNISMSKEKTEEYKKRIGKLSLSRKSIGVYAQGVPNTPEHFDAIT